MTKWLLTLFCPLVFILHLSAQQEQRNSAIEYYHSTNYHAAIQYWLKLEEKGLGDLESKVLLAEAYYAQRDFKTALEWLQKAGAVNHLSLKYQLLHADLLKITGNYREADSIIQKLDKKYQNRLSVKLKSIAPSDYEVNAVSMINTAGDDFSPVYYRDGIVFISNAKRKSSAFTWNNRPWLKIYALPYKPAGTEKGIPSELKIPAVNKFHGGPVSFTRQDNMIYFSNNQNPGKKSKSAVSTLGIYTANRTGSKWTDLKSISLNNAKYSVSHPTLNANGSEMYFVSDMPGGYGGTDIYYSKLSKGIWSEPVNLGSAINTEGNEMFPFLHQDGTLYFASEGHSGYGGLDIYYTKYVDSTWTVPVNMGQPVNSGYDDFGLILDRNKLNGYFSSNRPGGAGNDDIYRLQSKGVVSEKQTRLISGKITDIETSEPIKAAQVTIFYHDEQKAVVQSDDSGRYEIDFHVDVEKVQILTSAVGYFPIDLQIDIAKEELQIQKDIQLQKIEINKSIVVPNIYYELDKAEITLRAEQELKKLYQLLKENPDWIIEISAHTDSRADAPYNQKLSMKRAENVVSYLIKKGVSKNRLYAKGYGESKIRNHCKDGVKCTEEEHALNRRTEFKLIGFEHIASNDSKTITPVIFAEEYTSKSELVYKIQIGVFKEPNQKWMQQLSDLGNIEMSEMENKGLYRVSISSYPTLEAAQTFMKKVHQRGLKDAFIVPYYKGVPITLEEAGKLKN